MSKISCDVIHDLMPSFIDGICSEASNKIVNEHLKDCIQCQNYKDRMSEQDIQLGSDSSKQLDCMKKIRKSMDLKAIFFFLMIVVITITFSMYLKRGYNPAPFLILLPALFACNCLMFFEQNNKIKKGNSKKIIGINLINLLVILYIPFLMLVLTNYWISTSNYPFGLQDYNIGPFVYYQLLSVMILEIILWIGTVVVHIRTSRFYISLSGNSITGFCLCLYYIQLIRSFNGGMDEYLALSRVSLGILLEGLIITGTVCIANHLKEKGLGNNMKML